MLRAWLCRAAGLLAGASLAGLFAAFFGGGQYPYWAIVMPVTAGAWAAAALLALLLLPFSLMPRFAPRLGGAGLGLAAGFAVGILPVPNAAGMPAPWSYLLGAMLGAALVAAAARLRLRVPAMVCATFVAMTPAWALPCAFFHNSWLLVSLLRAAEEQLELPAVFTAPGADAAPAAPAGAPDVILVSIDTLRADAVIGDRPPGFALPFLDRLRAGGTWWDYGLSSSNQTLPGHTGMLLGRDAMGTTVRWNYDVMPEEEFGTMLAERFRAHGFRTAGVISNDLLSRANRFNRGFELFDDTTVPRLSALNEPIDWHARNSWLGILFDKRVVARFFLGSQYFSAKISPRGLGSAGQRGRGRVTSDQTLAALEQLYKQERPFFLFLHYMDPHQPYGAPPPFAGRLTAGLPPLPPAYAPSRQGLFALAEINRAGADLKSADAQVRADARLALEWMHRTYLEKVMFLDDQIARVHARVAASGRPAVWLITADHGENFGEHDVILHGTSLFEEQVRVPFFLSGAGIAPDTHASGVPRLEDVPPTLLALAGISPPEDLLGRALTREGAAGPEVPHIAVDQRGVAVRLDGWKALGDWRGLDEVALGALFRLAEDAHEQHARDLAELPHALAEALKLFLARDLYPVALRQRGNQLSVAQQEQLDALGYVQLAPPQ